MALERIPPPSRINFHTRNVSEDWKKWKEEFSLYVDLALKDKEELEKVKMFKYLISSEGRDIYNTMKWDDEEEDRALATVIGNFDKYCQPKKNETVERFKFNRRAQGDETIDKYITEVKTLAKTCNFGTVAESLIRDRIVCGIADTHLRERLLRIPDLTLDKAEDMCRASEITKNSVNTLDHMHSGAAVTVHKVRTQRQERDRKKWSPGPVKPTGYMAKGAAYNGNGEKSCKFCGRKHEYKKEKCPAYGQNCRKCNGTNHFEVKCDEIRKSKPKRHTEGGKVNMVQESEFDDDYFEIRSITLEPERGTHTVHRVQGHSSELHATLEIEGKHITFQLDSGASCNIVHKSVIPDTVTVQPTTSILKMFNKTTVTPMGQCKLEVNNPKNGQKYTEDFIVLEHMCTPLLGIASMQNLELVKIQYQNILTMGEEKPLTRKKITSDYSDVFEGNGLLEGKYHLVTDPEVTPVVHPPRKVPLALRERLKQELDRLEAMEVITPVSEPTPWVSSMVMVVKPGKLRICIDPKDLNRALKRSHYPLPTVKDVLPHLHRAKIFSVLDARNGFWHVELDQESSFLTTFNTPHGRYRWLRMPFGISTAPEEFQRRQDQAIEGLPGVHSIVDDVLVYGEGDSEEEAILDHDRKMIALLDRCRERGLKLNKDKLRLRQKEVRFVGHLITATGLKPDPDKVKAASEMPNPTDVAGIRRFIGFVNYLSKFLPGLSDKCEPLRKLTLQDAEWCWLDVHSRAIEDVKRLVTSEPVLKYYNPKEELTLQCDASEKGLGAAIMQNGQPLAFASRALTDVETRYAQIEKELLAVVFGLEKFHQYTYGRLVTVQSDHKPLEMIMRKSLHSAPKRLQRMLLRLQMYTFEIVYHPGKEMYLADTLSRAFLQDKDATAFLEDIESINMAQFLPLAEPKLREIQQETSTDESLQTLRQVILQGWPDKKSSTPELAQPYFHVRDELSTQNGIIFRGERAVMPRSLREDMKTKIHSSHIGVEGCLRRARETLYCPRMNAELRDYVERCDTCRSFDDQQPKETLISHDIPDRPWAKLGSDLCLFDNKQYLVTVDYYSNYWEIDYLEDTRARTVVRALRAQFARHGIPDVLVSDNGPQFSSEEFRTFAKEWGFDHMTSSPGYPQSNGKSEQSVKTAKRLMKRAKSSGTDPYLALLDFRNTPSQSMDSSPVQRLMNRRTKTLLPMKGSLLKPQVPAPATVSKQLKGVKERQAVYYDQGARDLEPLKPGDTVRIAPFPGDKQHTWRKGIVHKQVSTRSYDVTTEGQGRTYRRNRRHLRRSREMFKPNILEMEENAFEAEPEVAEAEPEAPHVVPPPPEEPPETNATRIQTRSRTGKQINMPSRFEDYCK